MIINHLDISKMTFSKSFNVYFGDTDATGVVYHGKYIYWLEAARIDFLKCPYTAFQKERIGFVGLSQNSLFLKTGIFKDVSDGSLSLIYPLYGILRPCFFEWLFLVFIERYFATVPLYWLTSL
tara:strand:- start:7023 stop:7391 length:369 start_codon:yes stop_codon:yes gene_type:complete